MAKLPFLIRPAHDRQGNDKDASLRPIIGYPDGTLVQGHVFFNDMQSDAAAYIRCGGVLFLKETVEHFFIVLVLDANACIGHLYAYMFFFRHTYFIDRNHHASIFPIVLDGIGQKVEQNALHLVSVKGHADIGIHQV